MTARRAWRSAEGFVVDLGPAPEPVLETLIHELPKGEWRELHEFVLLDSEGRLLEKFSLNVWSIEDELGISVFALIDDDPGIKGFAVASAALCNLRVRTYHCQNYRVERKMEMVVDGLQEVLPSDRDAVAVLERLGETLWEQSVRLEKPR